MRRVLVPALLLLWGCVYYNGMYNANRFANSARKAERQGRTFEAQGFWAQAEVRADSVIARHPNSSWADDAQLIRGESMVSRGDCPGAIPALEAASLSRDSPAVAERARVLLGQCRLEEGNLAAADRAFVPLMASADSGTRAAARVHHARVLRLGGRCQDALDAIKGMQGAGADAERMVCLAELGRVDEARPLVEAALARHDSTVPWDAALAGIGRVDPQLASRYTSEVVTVAGLPVETRDALLSADGVRLLATNPDSGLARLRAAAKATPVTNASLAARLTIAEYLLGRATDVRQLQAARRELTTLGDFGGPSAIRALDYLRVLDRARAYVDSVEPGASEGDMATFLLAESVRDGLPAPRVAAALFRSVATLWPASPYAPKALLALAALMPDEADSIRQRIDSAYPDTPYLQLLAGDVTPAVLALEDSLQRYAVSLLAPRTPGARRAPSAAPVGRQRDELR